MPMTEVKDHIQFLSQQDWKLVDVSVAIAVIDCCTHVRHKTSCSDIALAKDFFDATSKLPGDLTLIPHLTDRPTLFLDQVVRVVKDLQYDFIRQVEQRDLARAAEICCGLKLLT